MTQLEQREDSIKVFISNKEFEKALELTQKLIHPMHEEYKAKTVLFATYYDEYWSEKRDLYKELIFNKGEDLVKENSEGNMENEEVEDISVEDDDYVYPENEQYQDIQEEVTDSTYY
jgi:hypothetical protein